MSGFLLLLPIALCAESGAVRASQDELSLRMEEAIQSLRQAGPVVLSSCPCCFGCFFLVQPPMLHNMCP